MNRATTAITALAITAALSACTPTQDNTPARLPTSWVASTTEDATITQWTETSGTITGTIDEAYKTNTTPAEFKTKHIGMHGTIADGKITITADSGNTFTGTIDPTTFRLTYPGGAGLTTLDLHPGTTDDYNKASDTVRTTLLRAAEKAAGVQAKSDAAKAITDYQGALAALKTAATTEDTARAAAGPARDTVLAAQRTFMDYSDRVLAGACWSDDQFTRVKALYDTIQAAYDPAVARLQALQQASDGLGSALESAGGANAAAAKANGKLLAADQVKIPDDGGAIADGRSAMDQAKTVRATWQTDIDTALKDAAKVINGYPVNRHCNS